MLDRRDFVARLLKDRGDLMILTGLGTATFDVAAQGDHPLNFYIWSAMGCTAMVGLGLALARPDRRVVVITGDGDVLMALGSLATIAARQPANLSIVCLDNAVYAATGMQPTATGSGADLAAMAKACAFPKVLSVTDIGEADDVRKLLYQGQGPLFVHARVGTQKRERIVPTRDGYGMKHRFLEASGRRALT
jgi:thiamine pyrophosphate-dependent acetolactate synthase large subunit-like protein